MVGYIIRCIICEQRMEVATPPLRVGKEGKDKYICPGCEGELLTFFKDAYHLTEEQDTPVGS